MIRNIILSCLFLCLCIASALYVAGFERVELGLPFITFLRQCNNELNDFFIEIPDIPEIPDFETMVGKVNGLDFLVAILDGIIKFFNIIINIVNILADILNIIIQLIEFICIMLKNLITFKNDIINLNSSDSSIAVVSNQLLF